jgi:hypothetical protein
MTAPGIEGARDYKANGTRSDTLRESSASRTGPGPAQESDGRAWGWVADTRVMTGPPFGITTNRRLGRSNHTIAVCNTC